jgi:hypothetical protein
MTMALPLVGVHHDEDAQECHRVQRWNSPNLN